MAGPGAGTSGDGAGSEARDRAVERAIEAILGAPVELTREEATEAVGISVERARPFWRAVGFADVGDRRAFTRSDVEALRLIVSWVDSGFLDDARVMDVVRSLGQSASRLADWQVTTMGRILAESGEPVALDRVVDGLERTLPEVQSLLVYAWRRHLAAVIGRGLADVSAGAPETELAAASVGFADVAGFTRLSRVLGDEELAAMVEAFETGAADIVASRGARLVKTLGDEVMFVADDADTAVAVASAMHGLRATGEAALRLRIGVATGRLVAAMGDYYGDTVNRASRLTAIAKPGTTLVDPATEEALSDPRAYLVRHQRPRALRGLGVVRAASVRPRATGHR